MVLKEIQKIDHFLDREIERVHQLLQVEKKLETSMINNDLVYLYNEMLAFSYTLKIWLLNDLVTVTDHQEELLNTVRKQFKRLRSLLASKSKRSCFYSKIKPYQRLDQAI